MHCLGGLVLLSVLLTRLHSVGAVFYPEIWAPVFGGIASADQALLNDGPEVGLTASLENCPIACEILSSARPGQVHSHGSAMYERAKGTFWSLTQRELYPACIYQPRNAADVSLGLVVVRHSRCPFAVKSGGHGKFSGESNIDGGLTFDLVNINRIDVVDEGRHVFIGPGNRWLDVYTALEPLGIVVAGGRDAGVGVGGFLLGGGISFHSSEYGWGADTVQSYEVVLANGTITNASATSNPDLYRALRGGGANFGVVTAFKMEAIPYRGIWGGMVTHSFSETPALLEAFMDYGRNSLQHPKASAILNFGPDFVDGKSWIWYNDIQYTEPEIMPEGLRALVSVPSLADETAISNLSTQTLGLSRLTIPGRRYSYWVMSTKHDADILRFFVQTWTREFEKIQPQFKSFFRPTFNVQVITAGMRRNMRRNGGNVLGLSGSEEPLLLYNPTPKWLDAEYDSIIAETVNTVLSKTRAEALRTGQDSDFMYMNYASEWQHPVASYGTEMHKFMQDVAERYDPFGLFQRLQPGSFKLHGLPGARMALR
ncbi:FAD binding domain-containing protein [Cladophialophora immunda]|nr:FAD binding domain-containing protein [Cladophialophora immunda]